MKQTPEKALSNRKGRDREDAWPLSATLAARHR